MGRDYGMDIVDNQLCRGSHSGVSGTLYDVSHSKRAAPFDICVLNPVSMSRHDQTSLAGLSSVQLLPIAAPLVAAASGGVVSLVLSLLQHALWTIVASYILWGIGVPMAMTVTVMYYQRLTLHKLPTREAIVSVFLPLSPLGQGSFG
jgi:tellurite resistance protein TehA-like permease